MTLNLEFLPQSAFAFILIFARIGALVMVLPGIGDRTVPIRIRLIFALSLSLILYSVMAPKLPAIPEQLNELLAFIIFEVIIGLALGFSVRLITVGLQTAGEIIAVQTGLAFAQSVDPTQGTQGTLIANFLSILAVTLIFAADLHHLLFISMQDSYKLFPIGNTFPVGDFAEVAVKNLVTAFRIALQLASPFLAFGLIFYLGVGILSRLIPQVQIFFVAMPANIFIGFVLFMVLLSTLMTIYLEYFIEALSLYIDDNPER